MHSGRFVFSQVMDHLPMKFFRRCVQRYQGNRHIQSFTCLDQFLCMAFAQLTFHESLRDIEACLRAHQDKLYHMGIRGGMSRNTLANANQRRDWRIYAEVAQAMIRIARPLYADEDLGLELDNTVYALDASTIDLCLSVFPWALFRSTKSAVKLRVASLRPVITYRGIGDHVHSGMGDHLHWIAQTVDDTFGERTILTCGHRLVPAHPFGGRVLSSSGKRRRPALVGRDRLGALSS